MPAWPRHLSRAALVTTFAAGLATPTIAADATYRVVARSGHAAPGGGVFSLFGTPRITAGGRVAFAATLTGGVNPSGVWSEGQSGMNNLSVIARHGYAVPGLAGTFVGAIGTLTTLFMNAAGETLFLAPINGAQAEFGDAALLVHTASGLETVAAPGQLVPLPCAGFGCQRWLTTIKSHLIAFNDLGQAAFVAEIEGTGTNNDNNEALFRASSSAFGVVMREGDQPPNVFGATFGDVWWGEPFLNNNGEVIIRNGLDVDFSAETYWSVWQGVPGDISLVVGEGWSTPLGGEFLGNMVGFAHMGFNDAGQILFSQAYEGAGAGGFALWLADDGEFEALNYEGMNAPNGATYQEFSAPYVDLNPSGDIVFLGRIQGPGVTPDNDTILVRRPSGGSPEILVRRGDQAPGTLAGVHFNTIAWIGMQILDDGRVVFPALISGPDVDNDNNETLWITRPGADPALVIREGQTMVVGGQSLVVDRFYLSIGTGSESGQATGISQLGQVALLVEFTNGTRAIVVASPHSACPGDVNGDGLVNFTDLNALVSDFNYEGDVIPADLDLDGDVDFSDLNTVLNNFGADCND